MIMDELLQLVAVNGSLIVLLVLPAIPLSILLVGKKRWPEVFLSAVLLGCSSQAALGLVWSHLIGKRPVLEALFFLVAWCGISFAAFLAPRIRLNAVETLSDYRPHIFLIVILTASFVVRSVHPLQTFALGQSDAYTHLHYLHYIASQGRLQNIVYPSGYHWILALPVLVFQLDPYLVARFAGAFFGTALVLAIYVFLDRLFDRRSAFFGSFCAACFPGMILLMKTGVGSFANQFGLFLVPVMLYLYIQSITRTENRSGYFVLFITAGLGFAASVPMMLIHVFIIFSLERFFTLLRTRKYWLRQSAVVVLLCLPAILLMAFHFGQSGSGQRFRTAQILVEYGGEEEATTEKIIHKVSRAGEKYVHGQTRLVKNVFESPYFHLLVDLFTVKRLGFENLYINLMGLILFCMYLYFLGYGLNRGRTEFLLLGIWGGLTAMQAGTGFLQFSSYQREGWSLLIATCCLSGVIAGWLYNQLGDYRIVKAGTTVLMVMSAWWTFQHPPGHPVIQSSAEDLIIRTVRFFGKGRAQVLAECREDRDSPACNAAQLLADDLPLTIVTRRFIGWHNQGELVPNVMPPQSPVQSIQVSVQGVKRMFVPDMQYLVLIDQEKTVHPGEITSAFAMVAPGQVAATLRQQKYLYQANARILENISQLPKSEWNVNRERLSKNLTAYMVVPVVNNKLEF